MMVMDMEININVYDHGPSPYMLFMTLAIAAGFITAYHLLRREAVEPRIAGMSVMLNLVFVMFFGRIYTMTFSFGSGMSFLNAPFSSVGGLLGMLLGVEIFNLIYRRKTSAFRCIYVLVIPLIYSIAKLGCFFVGCCHGIPYDGFGSIRYTPCPLDAGSVSAGLLTDRLPKCSVFPVQLVETIVFAGIFTAALSLYIKNKRKYLVQTVMILGGAGKFFMEFLREENAGRILNPNQIICLILFAGAVIWTVLTKLKRTDDIRKN